MRQIQNQTDNIGNDGLHNPQLGVFDTRYFECDYLKYINGKHAPPKHPDPEVRYDDELKTYFWRDKLFIHTEYEEN